LTKAVASWQIAADLRTKKPELAMELASQQFNREVLMRNEDSTKQNGDLTKKNCDFTKQNGDFTKQNGDFTKQNCDFTKQNGDFTKQNGDLLPKWIFYQQIKQLTNIYGDE